MTGSDSIPDSPFRKSTISSVLSCSLWLIQLTDRHGCVSKLSISIFRLQGNLKGRRGHRYKCGSGKGGHVIGLTDRCQSGGSGNRSIIAGNDYYQSWDPSQNTIYSIVANGMATAAVMPFLPFCNNLRLVQCRVYVLFHSQTSFCSSDFWIYPLCKESMYLYSLCQGQI